MRKPKQAYPTDLNNTDNSIFDGAGLCNKEGIQTSCNCFVLEGLTNTIFDQKGSTPEEAYQEAFNLLVQNMLVKELAMQDGITTSDQEVAERVQSLLQEAKENSSLQAIYVAQAQELGVTWDSPEFEAFLKQQWSIALPVEKWNAQLYNRVQGDAQKYKEEKISLLSEMLSMAAIRLDESAVPVDAKGIRIPNISELPAAKETLPPSEGRP